MTFKELVDWYFNQTRFKIVPGVNEDGRLLLFDNFASRHAVRIYASDSDDGEFDTSEQALSAAYDAGEE